METRLRIIQVVNVRWFNATAWYGLTLARLLKDAGHDVLVIGLSGTESFARAVDMGLAPVGMNLNTSNPVRLPVLMKKLRALIKDFRPHVVNCHRGEGAVLWGVFKAAGYPFALVRTRGDQRPPKGNMANRRLHRRVDAFIATNSRTARQCREALTLPEDRLYTIAGGVDTDFFRPDAEAGAKVRSALGFGADDCVVGLLGRFDQVKGQKELIEAVRRVQALRPAGSAGGVRLMLLGFPTAVSCQEVEGWVREAGLEERVVITGKVDDVPAYINAMDLGVIASQGSEAIARAAFEIMSCGVPLIGTDVGVMPDLVSAEALVPVGDEEALSELLGRACASADFRRALQQEQGARMPAFSHAAFLEATLRVYESAIRRVATA